MAERADQLDYWRTVHAHHQATGKAGQHTRDTIAKGDRIRPYGNKDWMTVTRLNPKSVSVHYQPAWDTARTIRGTIRYDQIAEHESAAL